MIFILPCRMPAPSKEDVSITPDLAERLGAEPSSFRFIRASQNIVYEFTDRYGVARILRLTPESHRSAAQIEEEVGWIDWLAERGQRVCRAVGFRGSRSSAVLSLPRVDSAKAYHAVVFGRAPGRSVTSKDLTPALYRLHGATLGSLHACVSASDVPFLMSRRTPWDEERYFTRDVSRYLPVKFREPVMQRFQELRGMVLKGFFSAQEHGPVHFDLGYSNFFLEVTEDDDGMPCHGVRLCLFDFDNATPAPFIGDIAGALYSSIFIALRRQAAGDRRAFEPPLTGQTLEKVWAPFREGYQEHQKWPDLWNTQLPAWMEIHFLRAIVHAHRMLYPVSNPCTCDLLEKDIQNFLAGTPPLNFDFTTGRATIAAH